MPKDTYAEVLIKRYPDGGDNLKKAGIIAGAAVLCFCLFFFLFSVINIVCFLFAGAIIYGMTALLRRFDIEYEYQLVGDELRIDRITARASRRELLTIDLNRVESVEKDGGDAGGLSGRGVEVFADCSSSSRSPDRWLILYRGGDGRRSAVCVEYNRRLHDGLKSVCPRAFL